MRAFDSIKMGYRCKSWLLQSGVPSAATSVNSSGPSAQGKQWIVNAITGGRGKKVTDRSAVVLDGGPRWVLSTALGFETGGLWWTVIFTALFALVNYAMYVNASSAPWTSGAEVVGIVSYMILAAAISMASVPGAWLVAGGSGYIDLACGLVVELFLCFSVVLSAATVHSFLGPFVEDNPGLLPYVDSGQWITPALVWMAASKRRGEATKEVEKKLRDLWLFHPIANVSTSVLMENLWDDWSVHVKECASRVGGYSMLGFSVSDLDRLTASSPSTNALQEIQMLRSSLSTDGGTTELWIGQSLAFMAGYDSRLRHQSPESGGDILDLKDIQRVIRSVKKGDLKEIYKYQTKIENSDKAEQYLVSTEDDGHRWFYAGALMADSDHRADLEANRATNLGEYRSRLAVSLAVLVEGTDPVARLACYEECKSPRSRLNLVSSAISSSTTALVKELALSAGVKMEVALGVRGLAYATGSKTSKRLAYSPDEMVAASQLEEAIVISNETFSAGSPKKVFETLWGGSASVEKKVDVSDMVPLAASAPQKTGTSASFGWMCHLAFTLAVLTIYLSGYTSKGFVVLFLVGIPASDKKVSVDMDNHFYMIYISFVLNYIRLVSRRVSLSPRGRATINKANNSRFVVFLFVNILPVVACTTVKGWKWWVAFSPCILSNVPGFLNTLSRSWGSAFMFEFWSWHLVNKWYSGRKYLEVVDLRKRVGKNVLSVNEKSDTMEVGRELPLPGSPSSHTSGVRFMVVGAQS